MKRYNGEDGSAVEMDAEEAANKSTEGMLSNPNAKEYGESGTSYTTKATPKAAPKAAAKPAAKSESKAESKASPVDKTKMSLAERAKLSRESARSGSGATDTRSVSQRIRSAFGMKSGGATKMASGGMTSSASKRADGIATKGKTRGKMC
jgi:hypothetical protein